MMEEVQRMLDIHRYLSSIPRSKQVQEALDKLETSVCLIIKGMTIGKTDTFQETAQ